MMQLCYPHLKARGGGAIINFASGVGTQGMVGAGAYAAAKEAIRGLTKVAALEWGRENIRVNVICPVASGDPNAPWVPGALAINPMGRIGDPEADIGAAVVYLAGPGSYVTGAPCTWTAASVRGAEARPEPRIAQAAFCFAR